jgi:hypothetical protein
MKINHQKICALFLALATLCLASGCSTADYYRLKSTRDNVDFAMNRYRNEVSFGNISPAFQPQVNTAYHAYQTAFDAAVQQANSNYDAPTPDNVRQLANQLMTVLGSIPVTP